MGIYFNHHVARMMVLVAVMFGRNLGGAKYNLLPSVTVVAVTDDGVVAADVIHKVETFSADLPIHFRFHTTFANRKLFGSSCCVRVRRR